MTDVRDIRVFVASPDDVPHERDRVDGIVARLNVAFAATTRFQVIRWERRHYLAHETFQTQIPEAAACDIVIVIFGNKLGSELPEDFPHRLPGDERYPSGTAYELLTSMAQAEACGQPAVYVFVKTTGPVFNLDQRDQFDAAEREKSRLDAFVHRWLLTESRAFRTFEHPDQFQAMTDGLLRQWANESLGLKPAWQVETDGSPFPGLKPFDMRYSRVFFGRDRKIGRAIDALIGARDREGGRPFLLVVGPSGSGKSSLARAGVLPRLTAPAAVPDVDLWRVAVMRPGGAETIFRSLAQALYFRGTGDADPGGFGVALPELDQTPYKSADELAALLEAAQPYAIAPIIAALDAIGQQERSKGGFSRDLRVDLVLLVDQLEEIFARSVDDTARTAFAQLLTLLAGTGRVWIVATLRADLYPRMLDQNSPFLALKDSGGTYDLASPGEAELRDILEQSAAASGLVYERSADKGERLDDVLLREATGADRLPLLQFALEHLFEAREVVGTADGPETRLTFKAYDKIGGLDGAIDKAAEDAILVLGAGADRDWVTHALTRLLRRLARPIQDTHGVSATRVALTSSAIPIARAAPDEAARDLVDELVRARLLVLDLTARSSTEYLTTVRLAHERVLTSWARARDIVEANKDNAETETDIDTQWKRWDTGGRKTELLLSGVPLYKAEALIAAYGDELEDAPREFVRLSGRRARRGQRLTVMLAGVFLAFAVLATIFGVVAYSAEEQAAGNYAAAKDSADRLTSLTARELRTREGISSETVDIVFGVADDMLKKVEDTFASHDAWWTRRLDPVFALIDPSLRGGTEALKRSRATMLYEFARTYHLSQNGLGKAQDMAETSLNMWQGLSDHGDNSPRTVGSLALARMELADIERQEIERARPARPDFSGVRSLLELARPSLETLTKQYPNDPDWGPGYARVLTQLGDLDDKDGDLVAASRHYEAARIASVRAFQAAPNDTEAIRQLGWTLRKAGALHARRLEFPEARQSSVDEVCAIRHLVALQPGSSRWAEDLGWALMILGDARMRLQPADFAGAEDAYFEGMQGRLRLIEEDHSKKAYYAALVTTLQQIGKLYAARGDTGLAPVFDAAANDVRQRTEEVFPASASLPADQARRMLLLQQARMERDRGVMSFIDPNRRFAIESKTQEFAESRLPQIEADARGCWDQLLRSVAGEPP